MPLIAPAIKAKFKDTILAGLKREFGSSELDPSLVKIASAISDIAMDLVQELQTNAMVAPGIPVATAGSPAAQTGATTAPGKIL